MFLQISQTWNDQSNQQITFITEATKPRRGYRKAQSCAVESAVRKGDNSARAMDVVIQWMTSTFSHLYIESSTTHVVNSW